MLIISHARHDYSRLDLLVSHTCGKCRGKRRKADQRGPVTGCDSSMPVEDATGHKWVQAETVRLARTFWTRAQKLCTSVHSRTTWISFGDAAIEPIGIGPALKLVGSGLRSGHTLYPALLQNEIKREPLAHG